jgi:hypothetical protein
MGDEYGVVDAFVNPVPPRDWLRDTAVRVPWTEQGGTQSSARSDGTDADPRTEEEP